jgi:hypothetical protein
VYQYNPQTAQPAANMDGQYVDPPAALTRHFLLQNKLPVWVVMATRPTGNMAIAIRPPEGGKSFLLKIPKTKLPVNVSDQLSLTKLRESATDFWDVVQRGGLQLVWPADAEAMLGQDGGHERARVKLSEFSVLNPTTSPRVEAIEKAQEFGQGVPQTSNEENILADVQPRVVDTALRVEAGDMKAEEAIKIYQELDGMSERDLAFALGKAKPGKLRDWLQAKLAGGLKQPVPAQTPVPVAVPTGKPRKKPYG